MSDALASKLYNEVRNDNEERVFEMWHASSIADCPKSHYMKRLGIKSYNQPGGGIVLRWKSGHIIEGVIRPYLQAIYPDLESNIRLDSEEMDMTGEYDNYSEKEKTIFEVKSVHVNAFRYKKVSEDRYNLRDDKPYLAHELQNHCYVKLLREKGKEVEKIVYIYITLDGRIATYETDVQEKLLREVEDRLNILNTAWRTKTPPHCLCLDESHLLYKGAMQYCQYKEGDKCCEIKLKEGETE